MDSTTRRGVLYAVASGATVALAGCSGDGGDGSDGTDGGGSDGADGSGGDGGADTDTPAGDGTDGDGSGGGGGGASQLGDTVQFPESFAMTATLSTGGETVDMSGRFHQGNMYWEFEQQGQQVEWYLVGDQSYFVMAGQCFSGSTQMGMDRDAVDPDNYAEQAAANPAIEPAGRDTIDGEEVLVYEVSGGGAGETVTYYVLADSGYPRRIESGPAQWNFHSWGSVDPVEAPDMNCQEMPGGGMPGGGMTPGG